MIPIDKQYQLSMQPTYITPRLAILQLTPQTLTESILTRVESYHKHYFHVFNLTQHRLPQQFSTDIKWRGIPYSLSEMVKMLQLMDKYLRVNVANSAIICVSSQEMAEFARLSLQCYVDVCCTSLSNSLTSQHQYFRRQFQSLYANCRVAYPPVKIIQSVQTDKFIPLYQIYTEGRYNEYELVYSHQIEKELSEYYLNLKKPLKKGTGCKYYDRKPETTFLQSPAIVFGDVKIVVWSYESLAKKSQFILGFNTLNLSTMNMGNMLTLKGSDLYGGDGVVKVSILPYCESKECEKEASCEECREVSKKIATRYQETGTALDKLHRVRGAPEIKRIFQ